MRVPKFSVTVPVYNRPALVKETLDSILAQSFTDYEVVVVDDGSTDQTPEVLRAYGSKIRVVRQQHQGILAAHIAAVSEARGEYVAFLDSDDLFLPEALARYDQLIRALEAPKLIISAMAYFQDGQEPPLRASRAREIEAVIYRDFLAKDTTVGISASRLVARRSVFEAAGGIRSLPGNSEFGAIDFEILLQIGTSGPCVVVKQPVTVAHRRHPGNVSASVGFVCQGVKSLARRARNGVYPGSRQRRFSMYACIGGVAQLHLRRALRQGRPGLALDLLVHTAPMLVAAVLKRMTRPLRQTQITFIS